MVSAIASHVSYSIALTMLPCLRQQNLARKEARLRRVLANDLQRSERADGAAQRTKSAGTNDGMIESLHFA